jgi:hypothetical protein
MQIEASIWDDLKILSEAFEHFAPERKLALMGEDPEHATTALRRLFQPAEDRWGSFLSGSQVKHCNQKQPSFPWEVSRAGGRNEMVRRTHPTRTLG